jgi:hypothetical protein
LNLRKISFIVQIIMTSLTFIIGCLVILGFFALQLTNYRFDSEILILIIPVFLGVCFVIMIEIGVIVYQSVRLKKENEDDAVSKRASVKR